MKAHADDVKAIEDLVSRQLGSLNWAPGGTGDWQAFAADFHHQASLYPAARPARSQSVAAFVERMQGLVGTTLHSLREVVLGTRIHVFGNVAVAVASCEITENEDTVDRGIEMLLLVKDNGSWKIVSQAWDMEMPSNPIPAEFLRQAPSVT